MGPVDVEGVGPNERRSDDVVDDRAQGGTVAVPCACSRDAATRSVVAMRALSRQSESLDTPKS